MKCLTILSVLDSPSALSQMSNQVTKRTGFTEHAHLMEHMDSHMHSCHGIKGIALPHTKKQIPLLFSKCTCAPDSVLHAEKQFDSERNGGVRGGGGRGMFGSLLFFTTLKLFFCYQLNFTYVASPFNTICPRNYLGLYSTFIFKMHAILSP